MLKSKVTCWFCNKESFVFLLNKNSWNCESCAQYNGFNKDGDYNKPIPEMQQESKKTFCINTAIVAPQQQAPATTNLLCDKCNNLQEQKLKELNKFEARVEENFDDEYKVYKSKLDHIYDICRACKSKLNMHLQRQDLQIGHYLSSNDKKANMTPLKSAMQAKHSIKQQIVPNIEKPNELKQRLTMPKQANTDLSPTSAYKKKAYTVSGSTPYKHERAKIFESTTITASKKYIFDSEAEKLNTSDDYKTKVDNLISSNLLNSKSKVSCFVVQTILVDFLSFLTIVVIFVCDLVNLINDSGIWSDTDFNMDPLSGADVESNYLFKGFLRIYKYTQLFLTLVLILSIFFALKRPKMSRFLTCLGIGTNLLIHVNFFQNQSDEKYILEVFVSFFLASYMAIARTYNVMQFVRYLKSQ